MIQSLESKLPATLPEVESAIRAVRAVGLGLALALASVAGAGAQPLGTFIVAADDNIFAAGLASTTAPGGGSLPRQVDLPGGTGRVVTLSAAGSSLSCCGTGGPHGADGGTNLATSIFGFGGISGIRHQSRNIFLVGVFLGPSAPAFPAPPDLSYYSPLDTTLPPPNVASDQAAESSPALKQTFFLGDGLGAGGQAQRFHVPDGATRLFLGFADAQNLGDPRLPTPSPANPCCYTDNTGSLTVQVSLEGCATAAYPPSCVAPCPQTIQAANSISERTMAGAQELTRNDYLILFAAASCRTGVPAWMLKAIAFSEGLGNFYEDLTPRQFYEPCKQSWNLSGWSFPQLFSRYYGNGYRLPAFDAAAPYRCTLINNLCSCRPLSALPRSIPVPTPGNCRNSAPDPAIDPEWADLWPSIVHASLGDDAQSSPDDHTFGLGVMQDTFLVKDLVLPTATPRLSFVHYCFSPSGNPDIYPSGTELDAGFVRMEPLHNIERVLKDPQFNILLAAELVLSKAQAREGGDARPDAAQVAIRVDSPPYGIILARGDHGPSAPDEWAFQGGQVKRSPGCADLCKGTANPNLCVTQCSQLFLLTVLRYTAGSTIPGLDDAACLRPSPGRDKTDLCILPRAHQFALGEPVLP